jgi:hypothetical protein
MASSGTAQAAIQEESSETWFSTIFSMYGITIMLIGLLAALILYKRHNAKKEAEEMVTAGGAAAEINLTPGTIRRRRIRFPPNPRCSWNAGLNRSKPHRQAKSPAKQKPRLSARTGLIKKSASWWWENRTAWT